MTKRKLKTALYAAGAVTLALSVTTASFAQFQRNQTRQNQQSANPLGDLIGMIANASAKSKAKKGWAQVAPEIQQCVNTMFASKNINVDQIIAAGMSPTNKDIAPIIELCQTVMTAQLKTNFACNVANAKGQQVATTCVQSYAKAVNGKLAAISRDDFLRAAANDEKVTIADFETVAAQNARLAEERRLAQEAAAKEEAARLERLTREEAARKEQEIRVAEERRRFAASPEGKRRAAEAVTAANLKGRYLKFAPTVAQGFNVRNPVYAPPIWVVRTCNIIEEISFSDKGFQVIRKAPSQLSRLAISYRGTETVISFSDGTILKENGNDGSSTFIKGFAREQFWVKRFVSYDVNYGYNKQKEIGYADFQTTSDSGEYGHIKVGGVSIIVISLYGIINSHYETQPKSFSEPLSRVPTNIKYRAPEKSWGHFIGACRITFSR